MDSILKSIFGEKNVNDAKKELQDNALMLGGMIVATVVTVLLTAGLEKHPEERRWA